MLDIKKLKFNDSGLIPAVVQDYYSKKVLMVAYMNEESLKISMNEGITCFFSRSRQKLWRKGESSGNIQRIVSINADCDFDTLLIDVIKAGPACHTGEETCFFNTVYEDGKHKAFSLDTLYTMLKGRKETPKEGSYTSYLFDKGTDKILKKVGEECTEVIIAAKNDDHAEVVFEISDLAYHVMVLMVEQGIPLSDVYDELAGRNIVEVKVKQEKMK